MKTFAAAALFVVLSCAAPAKTVQYLTLEKQTILSRLEQATIGNSKRKERLKAMFEQSGCAGASLTEQPVNRLRDPNVICTMRGATDSFIIVGAHYDHAERGNGVVDNWSGASMLPGLFESLNTSQRRHTFILIGFSGEERGLIGSAHYVKNLGAEQKTRIHAMVNLDSLGLSPTKVALTKSDRKLASILFQIAQRENLPLSAINYERVGVSDSKSFYEKKIPTIEIHSVTQEALEILHSTRDTMNAIQADHYYDTYKLITAYLAALDVLLE